MSPRSFAVTALALVLSACSSTTAPTGTSGTLSVAVEALGTRMVSWADVAGGQAPPDAYVVHNWRLVPGTGGNSDAIFLDDVIVRR